MRLPGLVRYFWACVRASVRLCVYAARTRVRVCVSLRERVRDEDGYVWMCGGGDMVYECGCEGGQDENSDYTCASYVAY